MQNKGHCNLDCSQAKIKYEFSKPFPRDCWYVQQNMIIHEILTRPFSEKYKILKKKLMIKIFPIEDNAFLTDAKHNVAFKTASFNRNYLITQWRLTVR